MNLKTLHDVMRSSITHPKKWILTCIVYHSCENGYFYASMATLSKTASVSLSTSKRCIAQLLKDGVIENTGETVKFDSGRRAKIETIKYKINTQSIRAGVTVNLGHSELGSERHQLESIKKEHLDQDKIKTDKIEQKKIENDLELVSQRTRVTVNQGHSDLQYNNNYKQQKEYANSISQKKQKLIRHSIPDDFQADEKMRDWFLKQNFKMIEFQSASDTYIDKMKSSADKYQYTDWKAAWRNGMKKAEQWASEASNSTHIKRNKKLQVSAQGSSDEALRALEMLNNMRSKTNQNEV